MTVTKAGERKIELLFLLLYQLSYLKRDTDNGRCIADELLKPPAVTLAPFVWKSMYTYIIIGISLLLMLFIAAAITSCVHETDSK